MKSLILTATFVCFTGCTTQDRLDALGHPIMASQGTTIRGSFETRLRRLLVTREQKDKVFKVIGSEPPERVWNEAFFDKYYRVFDQQPTNVPLATREEWKRYYRLSEETYVIGAEDENHIILYFDGSGRLWQYEHF